MIDEWKELKALFVKILLPALMGISVKLAIVSRSTPITIKMAVISIVCGLVTAYLSAPMIMDMSEHWQTITTAMIAISGEKIVSYALYKINVERIFDFLTKKK